MPPIFVLGGCHAPWVVGARRLGKTSLLKELEWRTQQSSHSPFVALYWDLQGSGDARGLADGLLGSVEDSEPFRRATGIVVEDIGGLSVGDMLTPLLRRTVRAGWRLLLLVDEAEELLTVARAEPRILPRLRRILQKGPEQQRRTKGPRYTPVSKRQDKPDGIAWLVRNDPEITDAQRNRRPP